MKLTKKNYNLFLTYEKDELDVEKVLVKVGMESRQGRKTEKYKDKNRNFFSTQ